MTRHRDKAGSSRSPGLPHKNPVLSTSLPTTSREPVHNVNFEGPKKKRFIENFYDKENKIYCGRTCDSWVKITSYSIMYLIFLSTYTLIFLFTSLSILRMTSDFKAIDKTELLTYSENGIGLTASPISDTTSFPIIHYKKGNIKDYKRYIEALDKLLLSNRRNQDLNKLGPCGISPYGFGDRPCIIIRINKQFKWAGKPLQPNSTLSAIVPREVQDWMSKDKKKLWLQCNGYHSYDREHIGNITYYPDPPGYDTDVFPLDQNRSSPLVAIQISDFTVGISLVVQCKLWYERGPSSLEFVLYVSPDERLNLINASANV